MSTFVHLVYIHGFQGDDTSFQAFPKHLQEHFSTRNSPPYGITFQSSLYPTYKCVKPLSYATKNFLEWLTTQPPGPVILLAHSMGGLLAAEAAADPSNNPDRHPGAKPRRIIGVIAFDTPYLGLHPHVVISGIASLLPKGDGGDDKRKEETTEAMNDHPQVKIVDEKVTDDWEGFKREADIHVGRSSYPQVKIADKNVTDDWEEFKRKADIHVGRSSYFSNVLSPQPQSAAPSNTTGSAAAPPFHRAPSSLMGGVLNLLSHYSDKPLVRWLNKHSDEPLVAGKRWIVERYQFGMAMFDPQGLTERYKLLMEWQGQRGKWVNYWTQSSPKAKPGRAVGTGSEENESADQCDSASMSSSDWIDNDSALVMNGIVTPPNSSTVDVSSDKSSTKLTFKNVTAHDYDEEYKQTVGVKKQREEHTKGHKHKKGHHFVVLPKGLGQRFGGMDNWELVEMGGVEDEVGAHLGLFNPDHNLNYEGLIERVGKKVLEWCGDLPSV